MRNSILGTSALVAVGTLAAGPASAQIEIGLSGYMNTYFSVASIDEASGSTADYNPTGLFSDGEVHFTGEYTADNGIVFGVNIELEAFGEANNFGDEIDERFIYVSGSFGEAYLGSTNSAAYQMHYAAPYAGLPINSGWATVFVPFPGTFDSAFEHPILSTYIDFGGDENNITYYTPRLWGFQLGMTYVPSIIQSGDGKNFPVEADTETEYSNGFSVGLNYVEDFNGVGIAVSGGWRYAQIDDTRAEIPTADNYGAWSVGAQLSYGGFTVGGSYANEYSGIINDSDGYITSTEGESWDVGATYGTGPWTFGITYFHGEGSGDISNPDTDEMQAVSGGLWYALGPGIDLGAGVMWVDWHTEDGEDQSGIAGALGLSFSF